MNCHELFRGDKHYRRYVVVADGAGPRAVVATGSLYDHDIHPLTSNLEITLLIKILIQDMAIADRVVKDGVNGTNNLSIDVLPVSHKRSDHATLDSHALLSCLRCGVQSSTFLRGQNP